MYSNSTLTIERQQQIEDVLMTMIQHVLLELHDELLYRSQTFSMDTKSTLSDNLKCVDREEFDYRIVTSRIDIENVQMHIDRHVPEIEIKQKKIQTFTDSFSHPLFTLYETYEPCQEQPYTLL